MKLRERMDSLIVNKFKLKIILVAAVIMTFIGISGAFSQDASIYRIQSLFLYNFTKHVKWENPSGTFTVGIYGNSKAFSEIKANLANKIAWGKKINVVEITSPDDITACHIAYLPKSNKRKIVELISGAELANTLLVTEDDLTNSGAAISFVFEQSKLRFKISKEKIEEVGLKVSSSLISIGIPV